MDTSDLENMKRLVKEYEQDPEHKITEEHIKALTTDTGRHHCLSSRPIWFRARFCFGVVLPIVLYRVKGGLRRHNWLGAGTISHRVLLYWCIGARLRHFFEWSLAPPTIT